jgi:hypothetical protein
MEWCRGIHAEKVMEGAGDQAAAAAINFFVYTKLQKYC